MKETAIPMRRTKVYHLMLRFRSGRKGFSMLELIVVITVLAIVSVAGLLLLFYLFQSINYSQSEASLYSAAFVALNEISGEIRKGNTLKISVNTDTLRMARINNAVIESVRIYNSGPVILRRKYFPLPAAADTIASYYLRGIGVMEAHYDTGASYNGHFVTTVRVQSAGASSDTLSLSRWTQARSW